MHYSIEDGLAIRFFVTGRPKGIFCASPLDDMEELRESLKEEFSGAFDGLEIITPLPEKKWDYERRWDR
jgi:hypothetical protein